ncbi:hypothetical protein J2S08_002641 [Bacillus chungangensis]|uniref:Uncharacterized protein n=1 Tax=Bacillus chungangensis TaxID=587633 RepID=A0ABT9WU16_9BACI|nr:hypothetical protein [Bacillus chungangensis]
MFKKGDNEWSKRSHTKKEMARKEHLTLVSVIPHQSTHL